MLSRTLKTKDLIWKDESWKARSGWYKRGGDAQSLIIITIIITRKTEKMVMDLGVWWAGLL